MCMRSVMAYIQFLVIDTIVTVLGVGFVSLPVIPWATVSYCQITCLLLCLCHCTALLLLLLCFAFRYIIEIYANKRVTTFDSCEICSNCECGFQNWFAMWCVFVCHVFHLGSFLVHIQTTSNEVVKRNRTKQCIYSVATRWNRIPFRVSNRFLFGILLVSCKKKKTTSNATTTRTYVHYFNSFTNQCSALFGLVKWK